MTRLRKRTIRAALLLCAAVAIPLGSWGAYRYHGPTPPVEIYRGITYGCDRLANTDQGGGLVHWVRADLSVPGVGLYVTPLNPAAKTAGWEYKLRNVSATVTGERLAAAVNGPLFQSASRFDRVVGGWARSTETVVANGVPNHVDPNTYLLWWDANRLAHLETSKPPSQAALRQAVWAVGGQEVLVVNGALGAWVGPGAAEWRTAVGADPARHLVWIVCFDRASYAFAGQELVRLGAKVGLMLDGGTSMAMALGPNARGVRPGTVTGNWRPVATQFGFRAEPIAP